VGPLATPEIRDFSLAIDGGHALEGVGLDALLLVIPAKVRWRNHRTFSNPIEQVAVNLPVLGFPTGFV
jgi:hypothetical protein